MATSVNINSYPIFVTTEDDKQRWESVVQHCISMYDLELPKDANLLQYVARALYDTDIPTANLVQNEPSPKVENGVTPTKIPGRFDKVIEGDPLTQRAAMKRAADVKWVWSGFQNIATINGVTVQSDNKDAPSAASTARICYLLNPFSVHMGSDLILHLSESFAPDNDQDNPSMVSSTPGEVVFWQASKLSGGGAKIDENVFDYCAARALAPAANITKYEGAAAADAAASQKYSVAYQKKYDRTLADDIGPVVVIGAPFCTIYGKDQDSYYDLQDALSLWLQGERHGFIGNQNLDHGVKFSTVFPNRDRFFTSW